MWLFSLTAGQWLICIAVASSVLIVDEVIKFFMRRSGKQPGAQVMKVVPAVDIQ